MGVLLVEVGRGLTPGLAVRGCQRLLKSVVGQRVLQQQRIPDIRQQGCREVVMGRQGRARAVVCLRIAQVHTAPGLIVTTSLQLPIGGCQPGCQDACPDVREGVAESCSWLGFGLGLLFSECGIAKPAGAARDSTVLERGPLSGSPGGIVLKYSSA